MSIEDDEAIDLTKLPDIPKISPEEPNIVDETESILDKVLDVATPFEFICTHRVYDSCQDAHHYHVEPVGEYNDLDFAGHKVLINERERLCDKFEIVDGKVIITVYRRAD